LFFGKTTDKVAGYLRKVELVSQLKTIQIADPNYI